MIISYMLCHTYYLSFNEPFLELGRSFFWMHKFSQKFKYGHGVMYLFFSAAYGGDLQIFFHISLWNPIKLEYWGVRNVVIQGCTYHNSKLWQHLSLLLLTHAMKVSFQTMQKYHWIKVEYTDYIITSSEISILTLVWLVLLVLEIASN